MKIWKYSDFIGLTSHIKQNGLWKNNLINLDNQIETNYIVDSKEVFEKINKIEEKIELNKILIKIDDDSCFHIIPKKE